MRILTFFLSLLILLWLEAPIFAQQTCSPPPLPINKERNIFNAQQEMDLGDAIAEQLQKDYRVVDDDEVTGYLRRIGERVARGLPPTGIKYQFFVVDLPETNAFTIPGGRVYVTRKMIAFARTEDELAGVIAHELGHGLMHHGAVDLTRVFRETLGVTEVGSRQDIFDKYNRLIETARHKGVSKRDHEDGQQLEADRSGLYAMMVAGYEMQAFSSFWDRLVETKGKTGSWFSDLFGTTRPEQKRLREMIKATAMVPANCIASKSALTEEDFKKWQAAVIVYSGTGRKEQLHSVLFKTNLTPPLRGEITYIRFSPDGKFIVAQDDSGINVLSQEPFSLLFRIDAPEAAPAMISPDSQSVVVYNSNLHVERWNISSAAKEDVREVVTTTRTCFQAQVSSDGKYVGCYDNKLDLSIYDVATNELLFRKEKFYQPQSFFEYLMFILSIRAGLELNILDMQFSPDNRHFVAARSDKHRFGIRIDAVSVGFDKVAIAVDTSTWKSISLGANVKSLLSGGATFLSPSALVGEYYRDLDKSGVYSFPDGKKIDQFKMVGDNFSMANNGDYMVVRPITDYPAGIFDLKAKKIIIANKQGAIDVYGNTYVSERKNGEIALYDMSTMKPISVITLPRNSLGKLHAAQVSPDLKWLAASERSRGAVWDLTTGQRVFHIRGFRGAYFGADGSIYADFPKYEETERTIARMAPAEQDISEGIKLTEGSFTQVGPYVISLNSSDWDKALKKNSKDGKENKKEDKEDKSESAGDIASNMYFGSDDVEGGKKHLEALDAQNGSSLWKRDFMEGVPEFWGSEQHGSLTLAWNLSTKAARNVVKADAALNRRLAAMGDKEGDYLVQVLELKSGKVLGQLLIETGKGAFRINRMTTAGDWVIMEDTQNRILVYSLSSGELKQRFFGDRAIASESDNMLCVENERGQLIIYDLVSGSKRDEFSFSSPVSLIRFLNSRRLFVLTANQTAFVLKVADKNLPPLGKLSPKGMGNSVASGTR